MSEVMAFWDQRAQGRRLLLTLLPTGPPQDKELPKDRFSWTIFFWPWDSLKSNVVSCPTGIGTAREESYFKIDGVLLLKLWFLSSWTPTFWLQGLWTRHTWAQTGLSTGNLSDQQLLVSGHFLGWLRHVLEFGTNTRSCTSCRIWREWGRVCFSSSQEIQGMTPTSSFSCWFRANAIRCLIRVRQLIEAKRGTHDDSEMSGYNWRTCRQPFLRNFVYSNTRCFNHWFVTKPTRLVWQSLILMIDERLEMASLD